MVNSKRRNLIVGGGLFALGALFGLVRWYVGPQVATYVEKRADVVQTVVASGRVESPRRVEIGSALVGTVAKVPVDEGQAVAAGQVLVALDDSEARAAVESARTAVSQAEARVAQLERTGVPVAQEA